MRNFLAVSCAAFFVGMPAPAQQPKSPERAPLERPRSAWAPSKITRRDTRGLDALAREMEHAWQERHLDDAAAVMDFPIVMVTDDGKGLTTSESWTRERWLRVTGDFINALDPAAKLTTRQRTYHFVTDRLATIQEERRWASASRTIRWRTVYVCVLKESGWRVTSIIEGGWARR